MMGFPSFDSNLKDGSNQQIAEGMSFILCVVFVVLVLNYQFDSIRYITLARPFSRASLYLCRKKNEECKKIYN